MKWLLYWPIFYHFSYACISILQVYAIHLEITILSSVLVMSNDFIRKSPINGKEERNVPKRFEGGGRDDE